MLYFCLDKSEGLKNQQAPYATSTSKVQLPTPHPPPRLGQLNHMSYQYLYNISIHCNTGQITTVKPLLTDTSVYNLDTSLDIVLAPVVQRLDRAIHRINHYPAEKYWETNCTIHWTEIYPPDRCYPPFE